jgi:putative transposase
MKYSPVCRTIQINGKQHYLWRAVDQDGDVVDVYLQAKRDGAAAKRFFKRLLPSRGGEPRKIVTDKLTSYPVAHREVMSEVIHETELYANNRVEQSHEVTRARERVMRKLKSGGQAQRVLGGHAAVSNPFNLGCTWFGLSTIGISGSVRSLNGVTQSK